MNINTKTGKLWVNNYMQMYGTLFSNQKHRYIQLHRYYDTIGRLEGRTKAAYAMILHSHLAQIMCNRTPGIHANIFMYIDTEKGAITNSTDMEEWMLKTGWMNCDGSHLLDIASKEVWWLVFKALVDIGLLTIKSGILRVMVPIEGRMLPIPYAYVAFLSRVKKDSEAKSQIAQALADTPANIKTNLEGLPKEELINELLKYKTQGIDFSRKGELFSVVFEELLKRFPHRWGEFQQKNTEKNVENFLENFSEKIVEKISEKNLEKNLEKIAEKNPEKFPEKKVETNPKNFIQEIPVESLPDVEKIKRSKGSRPKSSAPEIPSNPAENQSIEELLFFADETTGKDLEKIRKKTPEEFLQEESERFPDLEDFEFEDDDLIEIPSESVDIFGLPVNSEFDAGDDSLPYIPEVIEREPEPEQDEFWGFNL